MMWDVPGRPKLLAALLALAALTAACGGGSGKAAAPSTTTSGPPTTIPGCQPVPPPGSPSTFSWLPSDLPMPPGSYAVSESVLNSGKAGTMVVPLALTDFVRFALAQYPTAGWRLGRGDAEPGEAEDNFVKGSQGGAWRVRSSYCDASKSELFITYVPDVKTAPLPQPTTTVGTTPHTPFGP